MTREDVLANIPTHLHATADELAAQGLDWSKVLAVVQALVQFLPVILSIFNKQKTMTEVKPLDCPKDIKKALESARKAQLEALAQTVCAEHCLGCCD